MFLLLALLSCEKDNKKEQELITASPPASKYAKAVRHYAEGMAYLGKGNQESVKKEFIQLLELSKEESLKEITIWDINSVFDLVQISSKVLEAKLWASEGDYDTSIILLNEAIAIEDALNYNEPPD